MICPSEIHCVFTLALVTLDRSAVEASCLSQGPSGHGWGTAAPVGVCL